MKSFARLTGDPLKCWLRLFLFSVCFSFIIYSPKSFCIHQYFDRGEYLMPIGVAAGVFSATYLISKTDDGPAIFAGVYSLGSLYLMNEWNKENKGFAELVIPMGLLSLAVANIALWRDKDEYTEHDVFIYNLAGIGLLTAYAYWEHKHATTPNSLFSNFIPVISRDGGELYYVTRF